MVETCLITGIYELIISIMQGLMVTQSGAKVVFSKTVLFFIAWQIYWSDILMTTVFVFGYSGKQGIDMWMKWLLVAEETFLWDSRSIESKGCFFFLPLSSLLLLLPQYFNDQNLLYFLNFVSKSLYYVPKLMLLFALTIGQTYVCLCPVAGSGKQRLQCDCSKGDIKVWSPSE